MKFNTKVNKKFNTQQKKSRKMETNFNIKVYDYMCGAWFTAARLSFEPDELLAERIADKHAEEHLSGYSKLRICNGAHILKEISYE